MRTRMRFLMRASFVAVAGAVSEPVPALMYRCARERMRRRGVFSC